MFKLEVDMSDIFTILIQDLKLETRKLNDFDELKRIQGRIKNYETRLKTFQEISNLKRYN